MNYQRQKIRPMQGQLLFKYRIHFLRYKGERTYDIGSPIVAIENEFGNFYPRRPDPGETHEDSLCFNSDEALEKFLADREENHVDHDKLFRDEVEFGVSPYFDLVSDPEAFAAIQPGCPSMGGWQRHKAFHPCVTDDVLELRSSRLLAAELKSACEHEYWASALRPRPEFDNEADLDRSLARLWARRKHRWRRPRKELPPRLPRFYRDAQLWLHRYAAEIERMREEDLKFAPEPKREPEWMDDWA